jgi:amino-acid N-acetyltransferase
LLNACGLPSDDVDAERHTFILALRGHELVGSVGLEAYGDAGLLRSLAVVVEKRGRGLGGILYERLLAFAAQQRCRELYLLTTTAEPFFARRGFARHPRNDVPSAIGESSEFASMCPVSAVCMRRAIELAAR